MRAYTCTILIFFLACLRVHGQHNSAYSQYMFNGLLLNPAYAGSREALDLSALYRKQWSGFNGAPSTITFAAHTPLKRKKVNLGLVVQDDRFGISEHLRAYAVYAYRFRLMKGNLALGLSGGIESFNDNWSKAQTTQAEDPSFAGQANRRLYAEAGFGMYYSSKRFYAGLSAPALYGQTFDRYKTLVLTGGGLIDASESIKIKPAVIVKYIMNSPLHLNVSSTFYWKDVIGLGLGYTWNTSALAYVDIKLNEQFRAGYAYEYNTNALRTLNSGSHECMIRYLFHYKVETASARYF